MWLRIGQVVLHGRWSMCVEDLVDIGRLLTVWSRLHPQAEAVMRALGRDQDTNECEGDLCDMLSLQEGTNCINMPWN